MSREFRLGEVISYPYLWAWQQQRGETEGRKRRPVCVVVAIRNAADGNTYLSPHYSHISHRLHVFHFFHICRKRLSRAVS